MSSSHSGSSDDYSSSEDEDEYGRKYHPFFHPLHGLLTLVSYNCYDYTGIFRNLGRALKAKVHPKNVLPLTYEGMEMDLRAVLKAGQNLQNMWFEGAFTGILAAANLYYSIKDIIITGGQGAVDKYKAAHPEIVAHISQGEVLSKFAFLIDRKGPLGFILLALMGIKPDDILDWTEEEQKAFATVFDRSLGETALERGIPIEFAPLVDAGLNVIDEVIRGFTYCINNEYESMDPIFKQYFKSAPEGGPNLIITLYDKDRPDDSEMNLRMKDVWFVCNEQKGTPDEVEIIAGIKTSVVEPIRPAVSSKTYSDALKLQELHSNEAVVRDLLTKEQLTKDDCYKFTELMLEEANGKLILPSAAIWAGCGSPDQRNKIDNMLHRGAFTTKKLQDTTVDTTYCRIDKLMDMISDEIIIAAFAKMTTS